MTCASKDSNQAAHPRSLTRVFVVRMKKLHHWLAKMCPVKILLTLRECAHERTCPKVRFLMFSYTSYLGRFVLDVRTGYDTSGPSCSKLTMSLVNDSLKFTSSDTQIC